MNKKAFEEARDFAGADWTKLTRASRERLIEREGYQSRLATLRWSQLPETVKKALAVRLLGGKK